MCAKIICLFSFLIFSGLGGCAEHPRLTVLYDRPEGIKPGDRVFWENQVIGSVGTLKPPLGRKASVPLYIKKDFHPMITDQSRFLIEDNPSRPGSQSVKMVYLSPGGKPLPNGALVEGSTPFSIMVEKGSFDLQGWTKLFQDALDRLGKEMPSFSGREWQKELECELDRWTRQLERSSEEMRRYFQREVLPPLEQAIEDFLRRLKELGIGTDDQSLEEKLRRLKGSLHSRA